MPEYHIIVIRGHVVRFRFLDGEYPRIKACLENESALQDAYNRQCEFNFQEINLDDCEGSDFMRFLQWVDNGDKV